MEYIKYKCSPNADEGVIKGLKMILDARKSRMVEAREEVERFDNIRKNIEDEVYADEPWEADVESGDEGGEEKKEEVGDEVAHEEAGEEDDEEMATGYEIRQEGGREVVDMAGVDSSDSEDESDEESDAKEHDFASEPTLKMIGKVTDETAKCDAHSDAE